LRDKRMKAWHAGSFVFALISFGDCVRFGNHYFDGVPQALDYDAYSHSFYKCQDGACIEREMHVEFDLAHQLPGNLLMVDEIQWANVNKESAWQSCAPNVPSNMTMDFYQECEELEESEIEEVTCHLYKLGILDNAGKINQEAVSIFNPLAEEMIQECLVWRAENEGEIWRVFNEYNYEDLYDEFYEDYEYYDYGGDYTTDHMEIATQAIKQQRLYKRNAPVSENLIESPLTRVVREAQKERSDKGKKRNKVKKGKRNKRKQKKMKKNKRRRKNKKKPQRKKSKAKKSSKKGRKPKKKNTKTKQKGSRKPAKQKINGFKDERRGEKTTTLGPFRKVSKRNRGPSSKFKNILAVRSLPSVAILNQGICIREAREVGLSKCVRSLLEVSSEGLPHDSDPFDHFAI